VTELDLEALAKRQAAFLERRLLSQADWRSHLEKAHDALLCRRVRDLVDQGALERALDGAIDGDVLHKAAFPIAAEVQRRVGLELRKDEARIGEYVPKTAREKIDELLGRPKVVPEKVLRQFLEQDAVEELLRDVLYDALKEFNEKVNPFFADWGLAGLLKKLPGFGVVARSMENVRAEFDKRLDPEIRKFLQGFSRRALRKMADTAVSKSDDAKFVALRRAFAAWVYEQPLRDFVSANHGAGADDHGSLVRTIAFEITHHTLALESVRTRRHKAVAELLREHGDQTVGEVLQKYGATARPDFEAIAAATWPQVRAILESPGVRAHIATVVGEFFAEEARSTPGD
jgi:hypothetical protein